jgi:hypothetical protein
MAAADVRAASHTSRLLTPRVSRRSSSAIAMDLTITLSFKWSMCLTCELLASSTYSSSSPSSIARSCSSEYVGTPTGAHRKWPAPALDTGPRYPKAPPLTVALPARQPCRRHLTRSPHGLRRNGARPGLEARGRRLVRAYQRGDRKRASRRPHMRNQHRRGVRGCDQEHQRQDQEDDAILRVHSATLLQVKSGANRAHRAAISRIGVNLGSCVVPCGHHAGPSSASGSRHEARPLPRHLQRLRRAIPSGAERRRVLQFALSSEGLAGTACERRRERSALTAGVRRRPLERGRRLCRLAVLRPG